MEKAVHGLGNGRLLVALCGLDVYDYKAIGGASLFSATHYRPDGAPVAARHHRVPGRAEYVHTLDGGTIREYVTDADCFVREFDLSSPLVMEIKLTRSVDFGGVYGVKKGTYFINEYPTAADAYFTVAGSGITVDFPRVTLRGKGKLVIKLSDVPNPDCTPGSIWSPAFPGLREPASEAVRQAAEDFFFLIQSYRADCGGCVSACEWNMGYVRDLYGASCGMLAAGWYDLVRGVLSFFYDGFVKNGFLATAYTLDGLYTPHIHECDRTENTGYIVLLADAYRKATGDTAFFQSLLPLTRWCIRAQSDVCAGGMLPFSGDETYVASGMLPKVHIDDGSAEATMLFIKSAEIMAPYMAGDRALETAARAKETFRANFVRDGRLTTNNPARRNVASLPPKKHGCCMYCYRHRDLTPNEYGLYRCRECENLPQVDLRSDRVYELPCVGMEPVFFGSDLLTADEQKAVFEELAARTLEKGYIESELKNTGYEYGLLLYGLSVLGSRYAGQAAQLTLDMRDEDGAWAEYYLGTRPDGMRWRPWEAGVNLAALIAYERRNAV